MGIFQSRPEEPDEWAGLPAEPWQPRAPGEVLPPPIGDAVALGAGGISLTDPAQLSTIEIAVDAGGESD